MKGIKRYILVLVIICVAIPAFGQTDKRPMTMEDVIAWERITQKIISDDGKWIAVRKAPWEGDPVINLYDYSGNEKKQISCGDKMNFSFSSGYLIVSQKPSKALTDSLKLLKTKKDDMPMDQLLLYSMKGQEEVIDSIKNYKIAGKTDWFAYQRGSKKDSTLHVRSMDGHHIAEFPCVTEYAFAEEGNVLYYLSKSGYDSIPSGLFTYAMDKKQQSTVLEGKGTYKQITWDKKGNYLAFLYKQENDSIAHAFDLYLAKNGKEVCKATDYKASELPEGWIINTEGRISFSETASRIYFGVSPMPKERDTTVLAEYRPDVQVWTWDEEVQYTQQNFNKRSDLRKSYTAVLHQATSKIVTLATVEIPQLIFTDDKETDIILGISSKPYSVERMWRGRDKMDIYTVDTRTGEKEMIKQGTYARPQLSPGGKYAYWYSPADSSWYTWSVAGKKEIRLTTPRDFTAWNEDNDVPDFPGQHGIAGWTKNDEMILIYDRYDIWQFDPEARKAPVNLTMNGRADSRKYRWVKLDREEKCIDLKKTYILTSFDETTKGGGYYSMRFDAPKPPKLLLAGDFMLRGLQKAKNADRLTYTCETYGQYPDIYSTELNFKKPVQVTRNSHQQEPFIWGTAELINWTSLDGKPLQGVVYKPENFDPAKQYPLIVNFYERNSDGLYSFRTPEPHRSTVDYHFYNSNGYILFNPDVIYEDGYPGESCYNCVMPGIATLINEGYINEKAIGAQGHSWGGYQVAYLATRTNLFAAIESGAPVVNMYSAYGGIRWGSGMNRSFQYEHGQSRIGKSIWEAPERYHENSPLFTMDKVETPILIMHNDADGHVPWYQGIEYFVALRRLQKPVWLLNYPGDPHWPAKMANRIDFQIRMYQFFEYYLNNKPMPKWMREGIPAVDQEFELGY